MEKNIIHFTDLSFQKFCETKFGVNRGVYNTIEGWLYEKGVEDVLLRRELILRFSASMASSLHSKRDSSKVRFGKGGLVGKLNDFLEGMDPALLEREETVVKLVANEHS